jgi:hypothetical protein
MPGFAAALNIDCQAHTVAAALANLTRGADMADLAAKLLDQAFTATPEPVALGGR